MSTATTTYTVLVMWSRPTLATPEGQIIPEVPSASKERTFTSKRAAWNFVQAKIAGATSKLYECGITVAADGKIVYRTDNLDMLPL